MVNIVCQQTVYGRLSGIAVLFGTLAASAALEVVSDQPGPMVFADGARDIRVQFRNTAAEPAEANLRFRLYQAGGTTLMPLGEAREWKTLSVGAEQTVLETLSLEIPSVRGETTFHVVWFEGERKLGTTQLVAVPAEVLKRLAMLAGEKPVALLDPEEQFKMAFRALKYDELKEAEDINSTDSGLILIGPMSARSRPASLAAAVRKKAASGAAVVWIQSPQRPQSEPLPQAYIVAEGQGRIVVASATTINHLADSPRAQLNLVRLAELATGRKKLDLPADSNP
jgi:hypothetical protein